MPSGIATRALCAAGLIVACLATVTALADDPPETQRARAMFQGLKERRFGELIPAYVQALRDDPDTPPDLRAALDYEAGKALLDLAVETADPARRSALLESARARLDAYLKAHPEGPLAGDA